ncbi:MAG TPA: sugar ABC transporter substrate-binding protein [Solirubrobacteraceae bacterium]|nr:sugar ABC transporter substrate-binding protein [Solirubrobacteraceae bacterium]
MRRLLLALLFLVALVGVGCGDTRQATEPDLVVSEAAAVATPAATPERSSRLRVASARIAVVSHGQASDSFWAIVKKGVDDAGRETGVAVSYRAPDTYDVARMSRMIDEAASAHLDGLVVSLPDVEALTPAIKRAERSGIPVISINSGSDQFRKLGVLAHVGQPEFKAGIEAGKRLAAAGVRDVLCVNQEVGNAGLDERCRGVSTALERAGGRTRVLGVDVQDATQARRRIAQAITAGDIDGIITLGPGGATPALAALEAAGAQRRVKLATFDLSPEVIEAVRDKKILFAVDQQPYLQGYLPVVMLAERARHLLFPARGELIPTGPQFVTPANAARVLELSRRGFR